MEIKKNLIVVAGGSGTRMGGPVPKQFMLLDGKAILHRTIEKFIEAVPDIRVITVLPENSIGYWKQYCYDNNFFYPQTIVPGGITRFHSVRNGLERVGDGLVAVHDGVRPLVSAGLVRTLFEKADGCGTAIPVVPSVDTVKYLAPSDSGNGLCALPGGGPSRSNVFGAQTPQVFRADVLREAYGQAYDVSFTDDASVVEHKGIPLTYVLGERFNIKITTKDDLILAEAVLSVQRLAANG